MEAGADVRQIDRPTAGLDDIGNPTRRLPFIRTGRIQKLGGEERGNAIAACNSFDFFRTDRPDTDLNQRQAVVDDTRHDTRVAVRIVLVGMAQIAVRIYLDDVQIGITFRMGPDGSQGARVLPGQRDDESTGSDVRMYKSLDRFHSLSVDLPPEIERGDRRDSTPIAKGFAAKHLVVTLD